MTRKVRVTDELRVCIDCLGPITYDDYTALDYQYSPEEADQRMRAIQAGMDRIDGHIVAMWGEGEYSRAACGCCGNTLAGYRYKCVVLG